jgi:hypothetical protein
VLYNVSTNYGDRTNIVDGKITKILVYQCVRRSIDRLNSKYKARHPEQEVEAWKLP